MTSFRKRKEMNETEIFSEVFDDNLSDVPSENENVDDCFDGCEDDSSDSDIIRPVKKRKVAVLSNDSDTNEDYEPLDLSKYGHSGTLMITRQWTIETLRDSSKFNLDYFLHKFKTIYRAKQQLFLDKGIIPWRGHLRFRTLQRL
ncbi:uncharacterized protein LOC122533985 [Frieseomelitta varia]|uniref:uncharacterized protein LOC122533985 n=1 Tax=Frieseomelitta varia TaxID=561572 RepID=UPI001CB69C62|nr:uncharacterized protein LOC122533985 [Frieseomelitta varia]